MIHTDPTLLRSQILPEAFHQLVLQSLEVGAPLLLRLPTGAGKSEAAMRYMASKLWRAFARVVVFMLPSRALLDEKAERLQTMGLCVAVYPSLDMAPCHPNKELKDLVDRRLNLIAHTKICTPSKCDKHSGCTYRTRMEADTYSSAEVVLIPEQLLSVVPGIVEKVAGGREAFLVIDEVETAKEGFVSTFTQGHVDQEREVTAGANLPLLASWLRDLSTPLIPDTDVPTALRWVQTQGFNQSQTYVHRLPDILKYEDHGLWNEADLYATLRPPVLPPATVLMGAYLDPEYLADRLGCAPPLSPFANEFLVHPGTVYFNLMTSGLSKSKCWKSREMMANLVVDLVRAGKRVAVLGSKDPAQGNTDQEKYASRHKAAITRRLSQFGLANRVADLSDDDLTNHDIVYISYGAIGSNRLEDLRPDVLITMNSYYVTDKILRESAYKHLPPSQRPTVTIGPERRVKVGDGTDDREQSRVQTILNALEIGPMLQAVGRTRQGTQAVTVVLSTWHDLRPYIGDVVTSVQTVSELRDLVGLETTKEETAAPLRELAISLARGGSSLQEIAETTHRSRTWVKETLSEAGVRMKRGRRRRAAGEVQDAEMGHLAAIDTS